MCGFSILSFSFSPSQFVVVASTLTSSSLKYDEYVFPYWANFVGWGIAMSSMLFVPVYAIYKFLSLPGTFKEVSIHGTTVIFQTKTWSRNLHEWTFLSGTVRTRSDKMITWKSRIYNGNHQKAPREPLSSLSSQPECQLRSAVTVLTSHWHFPFVLEAEDPSQVLRPRVLPEISCHRLSSFGGLIHIMIRVNITWGYWKGFLTGSKKHILSEIMSCVEFDSIPSHISSILLPLAPLWLWSYEKLI